MKILILGDVHGQWDAANRTIGEARTAHPDISHIFQVGDLGDGWPGLSRWHPETSDDLPIHWCDGNHDNFDRLDAEDFNPRLTYQRRGSVLEIDGWRMLFMGGATSIDKNRRIAHVSWWPQESITYAQTMAALQIDGTIDAVISHDRPSEFSMPEGFVSFPDGKGDREALQSIWEAHKPRFWFHGHYHWQYIGFFKGTEHYALPDINSDSREYVVWDGIDVLHSWS